MSYETSIEQELRETLGTKGLSVSKFRCIYFVGDEIHVVGELPVEGMDRLFRQEFRKQVSEPGVALLENELKKRDSGLDMETFSDSFQENGRKIASLCVKSFGKSKGQIWYYLFKEIVAAAVWFRTRANRPIHSHIEWDFAESSAAKQTVGEVLQWLFRRR